jgi:hypothetical protein
VQRDLSAQGYGTVRFHGLHATTTIWSVCKHKNESYTSNSTAHIYLTAHRTAHLRHIISYSHAGYGATAHWSAIFETHFAGDNFPIGSIGATTSAMRRHPSVSMMLARKISALRLASAVSLFQTLPAPRRLPPLVTSHCPPAMMCIAAHPLRVSTVLTCLPLGSTL